MDVFLHLANQLPPRVPGPDLQNARLGQPSGLPVAQLLVHDQQRQEPCEQCRDEQPAGAGSEGHGGEQGDDGDRSRPPLRVADPGGGRHQAYEEEGGAAEGDERARVVQVVRRMCDHQLVGDRDEHDSGDDREVQIGVMSRPI